MATKSGVYVAYTAGYPDTNKIMLWRLTASGPSSGRVVASGSNLRTPGLAGDAKGRVWVLWTQGETIHARRSDPKGQRFGSTVSIKQTPPGDCQDVLELTPAAAPAVLDIASTWTISCSGQNALFLGRVFPGLTVAASPARFTGRQRVTFTVTDAGVPVGGATVSAGGKSDTTDSSGVATIVLGPVSKRQRITATATKHNFVRARTSVLALPN